MSKKKDRWDERLKCSVRRLTYDFDTQTGELNLPPHQSCDMGGCVELFLGIDPKVKTISTFAGDQPDTFYKRKGKEWKAYLRENTP
jgi:hypothetical protein